MTRQAGAASGLQLHKAMERGPVTVKFGRGDIKLGGFQPHKQTVSNIKGLICNSRARTDVIPASTCCHCPNIWALAGTFRRAYMLLQMQGSHPHLLSFKVARTHSVERIRNKISFRQTNTSRLPPFCRASVPPCPEAQPDGPLSRAYSSARVTGN